MKVFVYGTLKKGFSNHQTLDRSSGHFIAECETVAKFTMVNVGHFPGVIPGDSYTIKGEVYEVDSLNYLDMLEGFPHLYVREEVLLANGDIAWIYLFNEEAEHLPVVENGIWLHDN